MGTRRLLKVWGLVIIRHAPPRRILIFSTEFHGMDLELLQKSLQVLVKRGRAQVFGQDDQQGVKFF
jgi:hypothetical protein